MRRTGKLGILLCITGMIGISFYACGEKSKTVEREQQEKSIAEISSGSSTEVPEGKEVITDFTKFTAPRESQEYNSETDYQYYLVKTFGCAATDKSYYIQENGKTMLFDRETHHYELLCSKPECQHDDFTCGAIIPSDVGIEYYNGNLYTICDAAYVEQEEENIKKFDVVKTSLDGMSKDKVKEIAKIAKTNLNITSEGYTFGVRYIQHRGYLYYIYAAGNGISGAQFYNNGSNCIYRVSLEGTEEPECILPLEDGCISAHLYMTAEGSYVYFVMADSDAFGELYRYNTESDVVEKMGIGKIAAETYTVLHGKILYKKQYDAKQLYLYDPMTGTEELFCDMTDMAEGDSWDIHRDEQYIYVYYTSQDTKEAFFVFLDMDGNYAGKAVVSNQYEEGAYLGQFLGGDTDYLLYRPSDTGELMYIDKAQIVSGQAELKKAGSND